MVNNIAWFSIGVTVGMIITIAVVVLIMEDKKKR